MQLSHDNIELFSEQLGVSKKQLRKALEKAEAGGYVVDVNFLRPTSQTVKGAVVDEVKQEIEITRGADILFHRGSLNGQEGFIVHIKTGENAITESFFNMEDAVRIGGFIRDQSQTYLDSLDHVDAPDV